MNLLGNCKEKHSNFFLSIQIFNILLIQYKMEPRDWFTVHYPNNMPYIVHLKYTLCHMCILSYSLLQKIREVQCLAFTIPEKTYSHHFHYIFSETLNT